MKRWLFDQVHKRNLIYNQCWEDPSIDQQALNIGGSDRIATITSAGCNTLDYLLRGPERIDAVDVNPHQTALLELKLVALRRLEHADFFKMFGYGRLPNHRTVYRQDLREYLSRPSQAIWDRRMDYFDPKGPGLYFHGTSGLFARLMNRYLDSQKNFRTDLEDFQRTESIEEQARFYRTRIAPRLWSPLVRFLMRRPSVLSLLGVPIEQMRATQMTGASDLSTIIEGRLERMFTMVPLNQNYFWRVYFNGCYSTDCCPNYLKRTNFELLRKLNERVHLHTNTMTRFLRDTAQSFTVFVLLDHMDWLTSTPKELVEEWNCILRCAAPGARVIYRSGGTTFNHLPELARQRLSFESHLTTEELQRCDRVGTYGSFYVARVTP